MSITEDSIERWSGKINTLTIGATPKECGMRNKSITVGGANTLPFLYFEGKIPNFPVVAIEVWDIEPPAWPDVLKEPFKGVINDPVAWAKKCVNEFKADFICLRLASAHPDLKDTSPKEAAGTVSKILTAVPVPLIIVGCGHTEKDADLIVASSEAAKGENCLLGIAVKENYKSLTAACISGGHSIIAESPIDINLAKQLNILISDMGFPSNRIVMHHSTGALGYGLEYTYSIMERSRLAALGGDGMMSMPMINFVGQENWRTKEAKTSETEIPQWGPLEKRGPLWEFTSAAAYLHSGADILVMNHPEAAMDIKKSIESMVQR